MADPRRVVLHSHSFTSPLVPVSSCHELATVLGTVDVGSVGEVPDEFVVVDLA
jgi:hypothetical protein